MFSSLKFLGGNDTNNSIAISDISDQSFCIFFRTQSQVESGLEFMGFVAFRCLLRSDSKLVIQALQLNEVGAVRLTSFWFDREPNGSMNENSSSRASFEGEKEGDRGNLHGILPSL